VIAGADAFFSTYGGLSYLGPKYGVASYGFYSEASQIKWQHLLVALQADVASESLAVMRSDVAAHLWPGSAKTKACLEAS
jgi:hypothetical protein